MMNFSAFGGPFSGIHQFAAKFGHDAQTGAFTSTGGMNQDVHGNRYHTNTNHFNQNTTSGWSKVEENKMNRKLCFNFCMIWLS